MQAKGSLSNLQRDGGGGFAAQQSTMLRQTQMNLSSVRASFKVAQLIASCGKSFSDGEFVKKGLNAVAEEVCPDRK